MHEPIISRSDFETVQRILENAPVRRPNGDGEIHPLSGLLFCKDCGAKMHIRIDYRNGGKRHVAYCSEYHKGKAKNPKCHSPHIMDADLLMQTIAEVLKKIEDYSISNRAEFEAYAIVFSDGRIVADEQHPNAEVMNELLMAERMGILRINL